MAHPNRIKGWVTWLDAESGTERRALAFKHSVLFDNGGALQRGNIRAAVSGYRLCAMMPESDPQISRPNTTHDGPWGPTHDKKLGHIVPFQTNTPTGFITHSFIILFIGLRW